MHIREPAHFEGVRAKRRARQRLKIAKKTSLLVIILVLVVVLAAFGAYARPLPTLAAKNFVPVVPTQQVALAWPTQGQAAVGSQEQGVLATNNSQQAAPMASVAKVMLALAVLKKYSLQLGQTGPLVPITATDVTIYNQYTAIDGSVVKVQAGEQITEYQALQAVLLPSANNMADTLAIWAYGSMPQYLLTANQMAQALGMTQTTFAGDASGFLPETVSTARDLILLGQAGLSNPVIKEIVAQKTAVIPLVGTITNINFLLGQDGIIGIKTGNSDQAGGCYLVAANHKFSNGKTLTILAAVMGSPTLGNAANNGLTLLNSTYNGFADNLAVAKGRIVANYSLPWGGSAQAVTASDTVVFGWRASKVNIKITTPPIKATTATGALVGALVATTPYDLQTTNLVLNRPISSPPISWRVFRRQF
jgi:D-alanyl-D-alanine carboxypeptidase (penicillin-binding protein 5/6)